MNMEKSKRISKEYYIVEILDEKTVIVNFGINDGAKSKSLLKVYDARKEVIDPIAGISLGYRKITKTILRIQDTYECFSICSIDNFKNEGSFILGSKPFSSTIFQDAFYDKDLSNNELRIGDQIEVI